MEKKRDWLREAEEAYQRRKKLNTPWPKKEPVEFDVITDKEKK